MKISRLDQISNHRNTYLTLGSFDGIHLGHKEVISRLVADAQKNKGRSVLLTFEPHPLITLNPEKGKELKFITTFDEKISLLETLKFDELCVIPFDYAFSQLSGQDFVKHVLIEKIGTRKLFLGFDQAFGKNRTANYETLTVMQKDLPFQLERVDPITNEGHSISSTVIRKFISDGEIEKAKIYLTYNFSLMGKVIKGDGRGRTIGFPTANIASHHPQKLIPGRGVYACKVMFDSKEFNGLVNIGTRPTFSNQTENFIEAYLLDFNEDIYGKNVKLEFLYKIRNEKKFQGVDELKKQISNDIEVAVNKGFTGSQKI